MDLLTLRKEVKFSMDVIAKKFVNTKNIRMFTILLSTIFVFMAGYLLGKQSIKAQLLHASGRPPRIFVGTELERVARELWVYPIHTTFPVSDSEKREMYKIFTERTGKILDYDKLAGFASYGTDSTMVGISKADMDYAVRVKK